MRPCAKLLAQIGSPTRILHSPKVFAFVVPDKEENTRSTRELYGEDFCCVMDAKSMGNLGRYLNVSL